MINKDELQAKLAQRYRDLLKDVRFHIEDLKFDFAEEVSKVMEKEGVTRVELARRMGTSSAWITKMLRTNWNMTMETMAKLAFALDMNVETKFVPIRGVASRVEYREYRCAEIPRESTLKKPEVEFPKERPVKESAFQSLEEEGMLSLEEAKAA